MKLSRSSLLKPSSVPCKFTSSISCPFWPYGSRAGGLREIERLAGMADNQPKWLLEDLTPLPFQRFESSFQIQVSNPFTGPP
jgi:hypothetical protein